MEGTNSSSAALFGMEMGCWGDTDSCVNLEWVVIRNLLRVSYLMMLLFIDDQMLRDE